LKPVNIPLYQTTAFTLKQQTAELTLYICVNSSGSQKNSWIARGFAREYLRSCTGYGPGRSVKTHSKSCSLHSKQNFWLGGAGFLWVVS